jgi:hypothetical protein
LLTGQEHVAEVKAKLQEAAQIYRQDKEVRAPHCIQLARC